jgi:hypothetical protein
VLQKHKISKNISQDIGGVPNNSTFPESYRYFSLKTAHKKDGFPIENLYEACKIFTYRGHYGICVYAVGMPAAMLYYS